MLMIVTKGNVQIKKIVYFWYVAWITLLPATEYVNNHTTKVMFFLSSFVEFTSFSSAKSKDS